MAGQGNVHRSTTRLLSSVLVILGVLMIISTVANGGGPLALGLLVGVLFVAAGAGRLYLATRGRS